jgi:hypothetical protein
MTRRAQSREPRDWRIKSVRVRVREGPERLRKAYRLLLQPMEQQTVPGVPDAGQRRSQPAGGA